MLRRNLLVWGLILTLAGCAGSIGAPVTSQSGTPKLTTEFVLENDLEFRSVEDGFTFDYPEDWTVEKYTAIWVTPSEADFPQDHSSVLTEATFTLLTKSPYVGNTSRRRRIPQSASRVAQDIANVLAYQQPRETPRGTGQVCLGTVVY